MDICSSLIVPQERPAISRVVLNNGTRVVVDPSANFSSVAVGIMLVGGSGDDPEDKPGLSHLLEHMLFKRTRKMSGLAIASLMDSLGGTVNAFTDTESLVIHGVFPASLAEYGLDLLAALLTEAEFVESELVTEKDVIRQEILEAEDDPADVVCQKFVELFWPQSRLSRPVFGNIQSLEKITVGDLKARLHQLVVGRRLVISVAGAMKPEVAFSWAETHFGKLAKGQDCSPVPIVTGYGYASVERAVSQVHVALGTSWTSLQDEDYYAGLLVSTLLGEGSSSRLFQRLREDDGLCYEICCDVEAYANTGLLSIYSLVEKSCLQEVLRRIDQEIERLLSDGFSAKELERAVAFNVARLIMEADSLEDRMFRALLSEKDLGRYRSAAEVATELLATKAELVDGVVKSRLGDSPWLLVLGGNTGDIVLPESTLRRIVPGKR